MLLPPTILAPLPLILLTSLPFSHAQAQAQAQQSATGYAFCSSPSLQGHCQYVASTMAGFDACNAVTGGGSLQVWEGTRCTVSRSENCGCDAGDESDGCEVVEGPRTLEDLGVYKVGRAGEEGGARGFRCEVGAGRK